MKNDKIYEHGLSMSYSKNMENLKRFARSFHQA